MLRKLDKSNEPRGLKKITDVQRPCSSPEHNPPSHIALHPGVYEYTCPICGSTVIFKVPERLLTNCQQ